MTRSYPKAIDYLYSLQRHGIKLGLSNIERLMAALGDPHRRFPSLHIAGTNGKGSTAAMIASGLEASGRRTGLYSSPHLIDFTERIRVNRTPIAEGDVARLTDRVREAGEGLPLTFFEFTTAMAFLYFAESGVEAVVAEVGLGGRFDATNVLTPRVSVITNVDFDHQAYLGNSLGQIAFEKAGIVKPGIPVVTAAEQPEALEVIESICRDRGAPLHRVGRELRIVDETPHRFGLSGPSGRMTGIECALPGRHQRINAACALGALELLGGQGLPVGEAAAREGLKTVEWPGRLETVSPEGGGPPFLLDVAHNPAGARVLKDFLTEVRPPRPGRLILVLGILKDKDAEGMLGELGPLADELVATRPSHERGLPAGELARRAGKFPAAVTVRETVEGALEQARAIAGSGDLICVTGSVYTVGEARAILKGLARPSALKG